MDVDEEILQWMILHWLRSKRRRRRRYWVHKINQRRRQYGEYHHLMEEILADEEKCVQYTRMKPATFQLLLSKVGSHFTKKSTNFRKPLAPEERLVITLRYLSSGESHVSLSFHFRAGVSTVRGIVQETCTVLWNVLQPEVMPMPDKQQWLQIAADFDERFNFPHCVGAIDGKHVRIKKPFNSGSRFYNYKGFFSVVLLAVTDASGKFVVIDVGSCGGNSDGGVFSRSVFGKRLLNGMLDLPPETVLPEAIIALPYVFMADDAFPLRDNIMKPFPHRGLSHDKEVFNYRLSRARNCVECSFGRLAQMWRILFRQIDEQPEAATNIVKAITILHNFILTNEPQRSGHNERDGPILSEQANQTNPQIYSSGCRATKNALRIRETLKDYFTSPQGALPWQNRNCYLPNSN